MWYLTLWDKISQYLANLEADSHFTNLTEFSYHFTTHYEEKNIYDYHTLLCLSQASYVKINVFDYFGGAAKWFL